MIIFVLRNVGHDKSTFFHFGFGFYIVYITFIRYDLWLCVISLFLCKSQDKGKQNRQRVYYEEQV